MKCMSQITQKSINDLYRALTQINELKLDLKDVKSLHDRAFKNAHKTFFSREKEYKNQITKMRKDFKEYKKLMESELEVKDLILHRTTKYNKFILKELVIAKNILKRKE